MPVNSSGDYRITAGLIRNLFPAYFLGTGICAVSHTTCFGQHFIVPSCGMHPGFGAHIPLSIPGGQQGSPLSIPGGQPGPPLPIPGGQQGPPLSMP